MISIIIPVHNEQGTIREILQAVRKEFADVPHEIIVVDDCSTDHTKYYSMRELGIQYIRLPKNLGKGAAVRTGFAHAHGTYVAIQDGDLEYRPQALQMLYGYADNNKVLYGRRSRNAGYLFNRLGNIFISSACNILYGSKLFDIYTCYKIIPKNILEKIELTADGFEIEAEITARLLNNKIKIQEIDIPYAPRTFAEGKKIRFKDALIGIWTLIKNRFNI